MKLENLFGNNFFKLCSAKKGYFEVLGDSENSERLKPNITKNISQRFDLLNTMLNAKADA